MSSCSSISLTGKNPLAAAEMATPLCNALLQLPSELFHLICQHLELASVASLARANRLTRSSSHSMPSLKLPWRYLPSSSPALSDVSTSFLSKHVNSLDLTNCGLRADELLQMFKSMSHLAALTAILIGNQPNWRFPRYLRQLDISFVQAPKLNYSCLSASSLPFLESLSLRPPNDNPMITTLRSHPRLKSFSYAPARCMVLSSETIGVIQSFPCLTDLSISPDLWQGALLQLTTFPPSLPLVQRLNLESVALTPEMGTALLHLPSLTQLEPMALEGPDVSFFRSLPNLTRLKVRVSSKAAFAINHFDQTFIGLNLQSLLIQVPREDRIISPRMLVSTIRGCPSLRSLEIWYEGLSPYEFSEMLCALPNLHTCKFRNWFEPSSIHQVLQCYQHRRAHNLPNLDSGSQSSYNSGNAATASAVTSLIIFDPLFTAEDLRILFAKVPRLTSLELAQMPSMQSMQGCFKDAPFLETLITLRLQCDYLVDSFETIMSSLLPLQHLTSIAIPEQYNSNIEWKQSFPKLQQSQISCTKTGMQKKETFNSTVAALAEWQRPGW